MSRYEYRQILKSLKASEEQQQTGQQLGLPVPPVEKELDPKARLIPLSDLSKILLKKSDIENCFRERHSVRAFQDAELTLDELTFLLWAPQGVRNQLVSTKTGKINALFKNTPSGGARNPFETYILVQKVQGLKPGLYRYSALNHALVHLPTVEKFDEKITEACGGQKFCSQAPVLFCWAAIPYRTEWRYGQTRSMKLILLDAGHIGQNLHLACEALELGTCMIASYDQNLIDRLLGLDGEEEFVVYMAPVGKPAV